jgi:hypothetical protein
MAAPPYIPSFYFNTFAQGISEPYTSLSAYQAGAIDENGNFLKPESSIDPLEYLIIKLKKIFAELPMGMTKAKLGNYMSTMQLFGEEAKEFGITDSEFMGLVEANLVLNGHNDVSYIELCEDMGAAGMATAGTSPSYNTGSVSGYDPAMGTTRRTQPVLSGMDNCEMFDVCPEEMRGFKDAKAWKHVPDSETKRYLQRYQRRNPKGNMALRSMNPDTGESDIYWIKFKPLSFMEEYNLKNFNFLVEETDYSQQFRDHLSGLFKKVQELNSTNKKTKKASIAELNARIFNHINNFTKVRSNPDALRHYMEHQGVREILGNPDSNSTDTHIITGFDEKNLPIIKSFDVKNVADSGRKNVYVRQHLSGEELDQVEQHSPNSEWVTKRIKPKNLKTSDRLYTKVKGLTARLKQEVVDYLGQKKTVRDNLLMRLHKKAQSKEYMIHENGRFYLVDHSHFDLDNPEISTSFGTPTYRTEGKRKNPDSYVDPYKNLNLGRGQASIRAGLKDTFRDENNRVKLDGSGLKDIESMLDDETKKHLSDFVKTHS